MLPFSIELRAGEPIAEQVIFAVKKAVVSGQLKPGVAFPSVRLLSQELRINPNTAHKIVSALVEQGVLLTTPGVGSVVAPPSDVDQRGRSSLLGAELERVVVEARKLGLSLPELKAGIDAQWLRLDAKPAQKFPTNHAHSSL